MSEHKITLPDQVYQILVAVAHKQGISPVSWIAAQLPQAIPEPQPLPSLLVGLTGIIDSKAEPTHTSSKTAFGEGIAAKLAKQGIHRP